MKTFYASSHYSGFHRPKARPLWQRALLQLALYSSAMVVGLGGAWLFVRTGPWW